MVQDSLLTSLNDAADEDFFNPDAAPLLLLVELGVRPVLE